MPMRIATGVVWAVVAADIALIGWILLTSLRDGTDILNHPSACRRTPNSPTTARCSPTAASAGRR